MVCTGSRATKLKYRFDKFETMLHKIGWGCFFQDFLTGVWIIAQAGRNLDPNLDTGAGPKGI